MSRDYVLEPFRAEKPLQIDYARELNEQQFAAVTAPPGPALVIAGAGAGKTRTLTYRVAFLLEQGIPPERILLLTFTNKAAKAMMRRIDDLLGSAAPELWGGTFHSIGHRILRRHADLVGYRRGFTISDREDTGDLIKTCVTEAEIDVKAMRFPKADVLADLFSLATNKNQSIPEILAAHYPYFTPLADEITRVQASYQARKQAAGVMDFDDLLALWLKLIQDYPDVREQYQRRFQFILVDEYQDTNQLQCDLIDLLAARHQNVMVVGDDSQSIYSWRGANFLNILEFPKRYPSARVYKIEMNYRSTPEILTVANAAIAPNPRQFAKALEPVRRSGAKPVLAACHDSGEQAVFVAQRALQLREEGVALNQMAVLYRAHFHALEVQMELTRRNIPFAITSGIRFFEQAHLKDVAAYLRFACNPRDEISFKRIVGELPGVGGKSAEKLWREFASRFKVQGAKFEEAAAAPGSRAKHGEEHAWGIATALVACASAAPKKAAAHWPQFTETLAQLDEPAIRQDPAGMIRIVLAAGYDDYLKATYTNYQSRLEDLEQLASFAARFATTDELLAQLSLLSNVEAETDRPVAGDDERLRLSSIHQAKGLEFDVVFVIMLCEGLFPAKRALKLPEDLEEERRLFYVAITRARNELYLSYPLMRMVAGSGDWMQQASRFLDEIPKELVEVCNLRPYAGGYQ